MSSDVESVATTQVGRVASLFRSYPKLRRVLANSGWIIACGFGNSIVNLAAGVFVARYLGPTELGAINYSLAIVAILTAVANLGLDGVGLREMSRKPQSAHEFVVACSLLRVIAGSIVFLGVMLAMAFVPPAALENRELYLLVLAFGVFAPSMQSAAIFFNSQLRSFIPKLSLISAAVTYAVLVVVGIWFQWSPFYFVIGLAMRQVLGAAVTFAIYLRTPRNEPSEDASEEERVSVSDAANLLVRDGWPQTLSGFALLIQAQCDQIMLGEMRDLDSVAQYGIALKVTMLMTSVPLALITSFSPSLAKRFRDDDTSFWVGFHQVNRLAAMICFGMIAFALIFGTHLLVWAYSESYALAGSLLAVMAFRCCLASLGSIRTIFLVNANILRYSMLTVVIGSILNVILNVLMIPSMGTWGAIYASFISFTVTTIVLDLFYSRTRRAICIALAGWFFPMVNYDGKLFRV
ncbi:MAG: flippase [Planctomycetota bacterium]